VKLDDIVEKFVSFVFAVLIVLMAVVVFLSTVDLIWLLLKYLVVPPFGLIEIDQLLEIFGLFLLILIGIELLDTIRIFHRERIIRVEIAVVVALLAVARKVIILDYKSLTSFTLLEVGAAVLGLAVAYYLLRLSRSPRGKESGSGGPPREASTL